MKRSQSKNAIFSRFFPPYRSLFQKLVTGMAEFRVSTYNFVKWAPGPTQWDPQHFLF